MAMDTFVGVAHAPSPDVRVRPPGFRSLGAGSAPASVPPLASYADSQGMGNPFFDLGQNNAAMSRRLVCHALSVSSGA